MTWTTTASVLRSRRPVRTVSGRAQLNARTVRGKGSTSGAPPGTACSPGYSRLG